MSLPVRALQGALPSVRLVLAVALGAVSLSTSLSACLVRLNDPYKTYSADGDVTGAPAACTAPPAEGPAAPTGPKGPRFLGRTYTSNTDDPKGTTRLVWSGSAVSARFQGAGDVFVKLAVTADHVRTDTNNDPSAQPAFTYYSVVVDGQPLPVLSVDGTRSGEQVLQVASGLSAGGAHEITITRESDAYAGAHVVYGLFSDPAGKTALQYQPSTVRQRRILIIGDSIACGAGVLGANASCAFSYETERATSSFGPLAAATLDAEVTTIATRTVGVYENSDGSTASTMSTLFGCADPNLAPCVSAGDLTKDPSPPGVIVVSLGTNDLGRANADIPGFQAAYQGFVQTLRKTYPKAHIFCALSPMLTDLNTKSLRTNAKGAIHGAVANLADAKVYAIDFPDQGSENGLGCEENPSPKTQQIMAGILATAIHEKTCW